MSDDHDWVARLLGADPTPTMPEDVADRLDRALRQELEADRTDGGDDRADGGDGRADGGDDRVTRSATTDEEAVLPAVLAGPSVVPPAAVPPPAETQDASRPAAAPGTAPLASAPLASAPLAATRSGRTFGSSRRELRAEDQGERRRRRLLRWGPVAAGVLVLGGAGVTAATLLGGGQDSMTAAESAQDAAAAGAAEEVAPRALVATGTQYETADQALFEEQIRDLVAVAGSGESDAAALSAPAEEDAPVADDAAGGADAPAAASAVPESSALPEAAGTAVPADPAAARAAVEGAPLSDQTAFAACIDEVTGGTSEPPAAVDLAVVDGVEATVVVVPDPAGDSLFVYVVGPGCSTGDDRFNFFTVAP